MSTPDRSHQFVLTLACPSAAGQVAAVVALLHEHGGYIDELTVFDDDLSERFFMRCVFHGTQAQDTSRGRETSLDLTRLKTEFAPIAAGFGMTWAIHDANVRPKVLLMGSKLEQCAWVN